MPDFRGTLTGAEGRSVIQVKGRVETPPGRVEDFRGTLRLGSWQAGMLTDQSCRLDVDGGPSMMIRIEAVAPPSGPSAEPADVPFAYAGPA